MSASLESLMRENLSEDRSSAALGGLLWFVIIGGVGAIGFVAVSSAVLALPLGLPKWLVSTLVYAAFIVPVYLLHRRFSFVSTTPHRRALPRYAFVQLMGLCLAAWFSWLAYGLTGLPTPAAALIVTGLTSGVNFVILRLWAFSTA